MTIEFPSARTPPISSGQEPTHPAQTRTSQPDAQPPASPPENGPLQPLARSKSLPARLAPSTSDAPSVSRPRRRIAGSARSTPEDLPSSNNADRNISESVTERPGNLTASEHRVDIDEPGGHVLENAGNRQSHPASFIARAAKALTKMSDVRTLLSQADDREFIATLRAPLDDQASDGARLDRLIDHVTELKARIGEAGLDRKLAARFETRLDEVSETLNALRTDRPLLERAAKITTLHVLLAPLPLAIPLLAKPRQQKTEAEIAALMAKALVEAVGMLRTPTTDNNLLKDRAMARYYANMVQALEFALPTFVSGLRFLNNNAPFNIAAGLLSTGALFGGFLSDEIRHKFNVWRAGSAHPDLHRAGLSLSAEAKAALEAVRTAVETDGKALNDAKTAFVANEARELSPHVSKQVAIAVNAYQRLADELADCIGMPPAQTAAENRDRSAKLALALFSTAVCVATTVLMLPDTIGTVDLASDAAFTSALMFSLMADKNVGRKDALEEFKTFVGLSLVMLAVLAANKAANDFIEHGVSGLLVGSITMTALNLTMPGPVGHAAAQAIERLMAMKPADLLASVRSIGDRVFQMFTGQTQSRHRSSVRIEELPPSGTGALPA
jgi:hypothetical protein